jgi:hypothetical protein
VNSVKNSADPAQYIKVPVPLSDMKAIFYCALEKCKFAAKDLMVNINSLIPILYIPSTF